MALNPYLPAEVTLELAKAFFKAFSPRYRCLFKALGDKYPGQEQRRGDDRLATGATNFPATTFPETHGPLFLPVWERSLSHWYVDFA